MANLGPQHINQSFGDLLQLPNGLTSAIQNVQDGSGNVTPLEISTTAVDLPIVGPDGAGMLSDLGGASGSNFIGFEQSGTGAVLRSTEDKMRDTVSVLDFGADPTGIDDSTDAMQKAHDTGKIVFYPVGIYIFTTISIASGGIIGEGKTTILRTTDNSVSNVITYTGIDPTGALINTDGGTFNNFTLEALTPNQKTNGAGISVIPANYLGSPNENYLTEIQNLYIRNIPISLSFSLASFFSVTNCYFSFYTIAGIYCEIDNSTFQDNGDNEIIGNWFFTNASTSPSARGIWYRCGGARIIGNKINGGMIGVDINPLRGTSIAIIQSNSIENQTINAIRGYIGSDFTASGANDGFSFLQFIGNQIGGYSLTGPAISINSYASDPKFYNCTISDNLIYNPVNYGARAIDIRQVDRFLVSSNFVDNATIGYGSLYIAASATYGLINANQFLRASTDDFLNSSTTTIANQIVATYTTTYDPPNINAGSSITLVVTANGASLGDYVLSSFSVDLNGIILSSYVSAVNTITFVFFNGTASAVDLPIGTINARVFSS